MTPLLAAVVIALEWTASPADYVEGYRIHVTPSNVIDVGNVTSAVVTLDAGVPYDLTVTAYAFGLESGPSNDVCVTEHEPRITLTNNGDGTTHVAVTGVTGVATLQRSSDLVTWIDVQEDIADFAVDRPTVGNEFYRVTEDQ